MINSRLLFPLTGLILFVTATPGRAQKVAAGFIDTTFGSACLSNSALNFITRAVAVQGDGKILAGGNFVSPPLCANAIVRLRTNGAVDGTFVSPFPVNNYVNAIAFQSDGKVVIGGAMSDALTTFAVARLNANGSVESSTTFTRAIPATRVAINSLAIQADDKIVAAGSLFDNGLAYGFIARLGKNGAVDTTFHRMDLATQVSPSGRGISALALQSGKVLVGGSFPTYSDGVGTVTRDGLVRLNSDGTVDSAFNTLFLANVDVRALLVQPDGKILVAGLFDVSGLTRRCLTRLNEDGTPDLIFGTLAGTDVMGLSLALQADGKVILGHNHGVVRLTTNGSIDTAFGPLNAPQSLGTDGDTVTALSFAADGKLLAGATRITVENTTRRTIARLWTVTPPPPVIVQQPVTQEVPAGTNVTFSVIVTGAPPIFYQWRKNGTKIKGATNTTLLLTNVHSTDIANYSVVATNISGVVTSQLARLIVDFQVDDLTLITNGLGAVMPDLTKQPLEIGRTYTITAKPVVGNLFSNWTGGVTSSSPMLTFTMQSNLTIVVNFVTSPFTPVKGPYNGLFFDPDSPSHENAGAITLTLDDKGGIRGNVRMGARVRKFSGTFSLERMVNVTLPGTAVDPALTLALQLDTANEVIVGFVTKGTNALPVWAYRNPFSSKNNPLTVAGNYNAALPGTNDPAGATFGDGFATLTLSTAGRVSGKGTLADGVMFKVLSASSANAQVPVYVSLYGGRGSLFGWLTVTNDERNDVSGTLWWIKPGTVGGTFYRAGVSNRIDALGSRYAAVPAGTPVLTLTNGVVEISSGNPGESFTNSVTLGGDNKITGNNQLTLTISPAKGSVTGSFIDPSTTRKRTIKGVALPQHQQARGFFLSTDESGGVFVGNAP